MAYSLTATTEERMKAWREGLLSDAEIMEDLVSDALINLQAQTEVLNSMKAREKDAAEKRVVCIYGKRELKIVETK